VDDDRDPEGFRALVSGAQHRPDGGDKEHPGDDGCRCTGVVREVHRRGEEARTGEGRRGAELFLEPPPDRALKSRSSVGTTGTTGTMERTAATTPKVVSSPSSSTPSATANATPIRIETTSPTTMSPSASRTAHIGECDGRDGDGHCRFEAPGHRGIAFDDPELAEL
jgi:hypothetical protein